MRWDTRIAILAGLLCLLSAGWYFRVLRPDQRRQGIAIDFTTPPVELAFDERPRPEQLQQPPAQKPASKPQQPTRPLVAAPRGETQVVEPAPPVQGPEPKPAPQVVQPAQPKPAPAGPRYYTVKSGDSLWRIAKEQLGDPNRHTELFELNAAALNNDPDSLRLGQKLILPPK